MPKPNLNNLKPTNEKKFQNGSNKKRNDEKYSTPASHVGAFKLIYNKHLNRVIAPLYKSLGLSAQPQIISEIQYRPEERIMVRYGSFKNILSHNSCPACIMWASTKQWSSVGIRRKMLAFTTMSVTVDHHMLTSQLCYAILKMAALHNFG